MSRSKAPIGTPYVHAFGHIDISMLLLAMLTLVTVEYLSETILAWNNYTLFSSWMLRKHFDPIRGVSRCLFGPISYVLLGNLVGIYDIHLQLLIMIMCSISYAIFFTTEVLPFIGNEKFNLNNLMKFLDLINNLAKLLSTTAWLIVIFYMFANYDVLPYFVFIAIVGASCIGFLFALNHYNWFSAKKYSFIQATFYNTLITIFMTSFLSWTLYLGFK